MQDLVSRRGCPLCGGNDVLPVQSLEEFQFFDAPVCIDLYTVQCRSCGCCYQNPCYTPEGMACLFAKASVSYQHWGDVDPGERWEWLQQQGILGETASLVDIGCGTGRFLAAAPAHVAIAGMDIDAASLRIAQREVPRARFWATNLDVCDFSACRGAYPATCLTLFHVLEHVRDPRRLLRMLRATFPGALLCVEVPVIDGEPTDDIHGFFAPLHVTHFSRRTLRAMLALEGWGVLDDWYDRAYQGYRLLCRQDTHGQYGYAEPVPQYAQEASGVCERLTRQAQARQSVAQQLSRIGGRQVFIWGAGLHTEMLWQHTTLFTEAPVVGLVDNDATKQGTAWRGYPIQAPESVAKYCWERDERRLVLSSYDAWPLMRRAAVDFGIPETALLALYARTV